MVNMVAPDCNERITRGFWDIDDTSLGVAFQLLPSFAVGKASAAPTYKYLQISCKKTYKNSVAAIFTIIGGPYPSAENQHVQTTAD